jgi:topoisomerase-4 subunit B
MKPQYNEESIQILEGLEAVRKRPGMYIGSTDSRGLHHLVNEIVDNSIDEVLAGYGKEIDVTICKDNSIIVEDFGRGMPIGLHSSGRPTIEVIFNVLHAGGKFSADNGYKTSGGLHGVGASVVNALSLFVEVTVCRDGKIVSQRYEKGGKVIKKLQVIGETKKTGTKIHFKPDPQIFSTTLYSFDILKERVRESAFLIKGLKMVLKDERVNKTETFLYENGIKEYILYLNEGKEAVNQPCYFEGKNNDIEFEIALQYTKSYSETLISFVNNVRTKDGGTHEVGYKSSLTKSINEYARKYNILKEKDSNLEGVDIREGITTIISVRIPENLLQFEGQTKDKLGTPEAKAAIENFLYDKMSFYLEENKELANIIIKKAVDSQRAREAARKAREDARNINKKNKKETNLSGKLAPCQSKDKSINELFIVEGDSAGGSAKLGRDSKYQAILPLRGKVINAEKAKLEDLLKNEEISTLIYTIGADYGLDFDIKKCNYDKVIIMTDADTDGAHIQVLLLTFFFRFMQPLIEAGKLYIAMPPLYKVTKKNSKKNEYRYAWSDEELQSIVKNDSGNNMIQRFKGLGEMNGEQLWETTMDPRTRTLLRVNIEDLYESERRIQILMGSEVEPRREWIENNVSFTLEDDFEIQGGNK